MSVSSIMAEAKYPYPGNVDADIWVSAGQSNMAGGGLLIKKQKTDNRIMSFNSNNKWIIAEEPITRIFSAVAPAIKDRLIAGWGEESYKAVTEQEKKKPFGGVSPDLYFARHLVKHTGKNIGIVPCALGATSMGEWSPSLKDKGNASLYGNMLDRISMVGGKIKGIIWYQGEGETGPGLQEPFENTWLNFVDSVRRDTGIPDLPIIYVQISRYCIDLPDQNYHLAWEAIRDKQRTAAYKRDNLFVVPAIDLPLDDLIHIGAAGHVRLGKRMAEVALDKVYKAKGHATAIDYDSYEILPMIDVLHNTMRVKFKGVNGKLQAKGSPRGFSLRSDELGKDGPMVFKVDFDPKDPSSVIVWYSKPIEKPIKLYYGAGLDPYTNIVDSKDMAVPAFGPILIEPKK
ncbi:MAG: sialate O-acetylesterase [Armatimonadota bacterium]